MRDEITHLQSERKKTYTTIVKWLWRGVGAVILAVAVVFLGLSFTDLPSVKELENPKSELASQVYADNGEVFGRYYIENRVPVSFNDLSPAMVEALVATEDERFYQHSGIDFRALMRAVVKTAILGQESSGGASTLTQQLAKLLFTERASSGITERLVQKLKEWIIALRLERRYTKEEIIAMYLNKFDFLYDSYGIKAAAETYFAKTQDSLTILESATLVGMLKNPSLYNPIRRTELTQQRRNVVLSQMVRNNFLTPAEYDSLKTKPLDISRFNRSTHTGGLATYFRMVLAEDLKNLLQRDEYRKPDGDVYNIYRDGLKIYTTIDPVIQAHAEKAAAEHMQEVQETFNTHWKNKDPWTYKTWETTDREMRIRKLTLKRLMRESDRYQDLYANYMGNAADAIEKEVSDFQLDAVDLEHIMAEEERENAIAQLVDNQTISSSLAAKYRKIRRSTSFPQLKEQWTRFQKAVDKVFNTPVKMTVFAYNDKMETDTVMSPIDSIKYHRMFLQIGSMAVEPTTGQVKAWVGGINHKYFQYDHVRTSRQVGSTFKPFVYATAIALQGFSPCYTVDDRPWTIYADEANFGLLEDWQPNNSSGTYSYNRYTLRDALKASKNSITAYLIKQIRDVSPVVGLIHNMGIDSTKRYANGRYRVPRQPSIALGATDLTVFEMTGAYTTFANNGYYNRPFFVTRIEDKNGRVIFQELPDERLALNPNANYVMVDMLKYSASGARNFWKLKSEVGGKTGTTNDYIDGWFMGITPSLVVGTWVGGDDRWIRFRGLLYGQGAYMARPFFQRLIETLENDPDADYDINARFQRPSGDLGIELNCDVYQQESESFRARAGSGTNNGNGFFDDMFGDEELPEADSTDIDTGTFENDF